MGHLEKYASFVEYSGTANEPVVYSHAPEVVSEIMTKFDVRRRKTYNPPDLKRVLRDKDKDLVAALTIGFMDGDGTICFQSGRKDCFLQVKCHGSWIDNLQYFSDLIGNMASTRPTRASINKYGYSIFTVSNSIALKFLKREAVKLGLPVMERKWDKIDLEFVGRAEQAGINKVSVKSLLLDGLNQKKISEKVGVSQSGISLMITRNPEYFKV